MKALTLLLPAALVSELGWTLIHFLWQGTAIALLYALCQRLLRRDSANLRYLAGCLALLLIFTGWLQVRRILRRSTLAPQEVWRFKLASLLEKMAMSRAVRLLQSAWVEVPTVIGCLKPVILVPASAFTGLSPDQVELLLAHELAHIRRHDYLVNTLQNAIEILLLKRCL